MDKKRSDSLHTVSTVGMRVDGIVKRNSEPKRNTVRFAQSEQDIYRASSVGHKHQYSKFTPHNRHLNNNIKITTILTQSIVAYLGTVQLVATDDEIPPKSISAMKASVEKLRKEQHIHQRVLLKINQHGVKLYNADSDVIAVYDADEICFSSICPGDGRFFSIVTCWGENQIKCHQFLVDSNIQHHSAHAEIAKRFAVHCSTDKETGYCTEFPNSPKILHKMIQSLFVSREEKISNSILRESSNRSSISAADSGLGGITFGDKIPFDQQRIMQIQDLKFSKKNKKNGRSGNSFFSRYGKRSSSRGDKSNLKNHMSKSSESIPLSDTGSLSTASSMESVASNASLPSCVNGKLSASSSVKMAKEVSNSAGRVPLWAISFDRLLEDPEGLKYLTEFLRKEFSEENILFWLECEKIRKMSTENMKELQELADSIYERFLSNDAPSPINIDSKGQRIADESRNHAATPDMYEYQQMQIYKLMKLDSYGRFLKSSLYRQCIVNEMEGRPLPLDTDFDNSSIKSNQQNDDTSDTSSFKKRFGIFQSSNKSNKSRESSNNSLQMQDSFDQTVDETSGSQMFQMPTEADMTKICRLYLWDGTTTVMYAAGDTTIRDALGVLCERRGVGLSAVDVFYSGEDRPLSLDQDICVLAGQEVVVEKRTLFRLDMLPIRRSVGIKAKSTKTVIDVLKPVLVKYGLEFGELQAKISGEKSLLDMELQVNVLDNLRVAVDYMPGSTINESYKGQRKKSKDKYKTLNTKSNGTLKRDVETKPAVMNKNDKNDLMKIMSASQSGKLDDQRGLISEMNLELPDFLKVKDNISLSQTSDDTSTIASDISSDNFQKEGMVINNNNNNSLFRKHNVVLEADSVSLKSVQSETSENAHCLNTITHQHRSMSHNQIHSTNQRRCSNNWNDISIPRTMTSHKPSYHHSYSTNSTSKLISSATATDNDKFISNNDFSFKDSDKNSTKRKIKSVLV